MRTHHHATAFAIVLAALTLGGCGDDTSGTGGAAGSGGSDATSTTTDASSSTATTVASSTATSSTGGDTGGGAGTGGDGTGGAGTGGEGTGGAGGAAVGELTLLWENVGFPEDGLRLDLEQFVGVTLQVRETGTEDVLLELADQTLPAGFVVHAYFIGLTGDDTLDTFLVQDDDEFTEPDVGDGNIRLAHFSPGVEAVDVYLTDEIFQMYGPLLDTDTFDFPAMSRYGSFPAGTYEATVVLTGGDPFTDAIATIPGLVIEEGKTATMALVGRTVDDLDVLLWDDDVSEPEAGFGAVTFVHASPDSPNVDVGALFPAP